jgi:PiT family inorganic phosphate transporter
MWIIEHNILLASMTIIFGLLMAGAVGANDVANAMGTSVGSKVLSIRQAIIIAGIFETLGALLASGQVSQTLSTGLINVEHFANNTDILALGMIASLMAAGSWLLIATKYGWPVSTTHSIVGAIIGFSSLGIGVSQVNWAMVRDITLTWLFTPVIAAVLAFLLFYWVQQSILSAENPTKAAIKIIPYYMFLSSIVLIWVTLAKGLAPLGLSLSSNKIYFYSVLISIISSLLGRLWLISFLRKSEKFKNPFKGVEQSFGVLVVFTACAMAFAHGSNDTANAIGPMATIFSLIKNNGQLVIHSHLPFWIVALGTSGVVAGLALFGYKVIATVGSKITELTPSRGFAAQLSTAATVVICSGLGLPVSTTQILIGALLGVGFARGIGAINLHVIRSIFMSWLITLPAGALLSIVFYKLLIKIIFVI